MKTSLIKVKRGQKGYGLSLVYRGPDKYEEKDLGVFVSRVVAGGQAERYGLREGDKVISINKIAPRTVEDAVSLIRDAGKHIQVEMISEVDRLQAQQPPSDTGSSHHRPSPYVRTSPASHRPPAPGAMASGHSDIRRGQVISPGMGPGQLYTNQNDATSASAHYSKPQKITERNLREFDQMTQGERASIRDRERPMSPGASSIKSSRSLRELGIESYPYPEMPEGKGPMKLSRTQERQSLQNLNNRLAGYIDKVRSLEQDNSKLSKEIHKWESSQNQEISNIKYVYDQEIGSLKEALNGISQQYNQLKVASEGLFNENQDMRDNIRKKNNDMDNTKTIVDDLHAEIRDLSVRLRGIEADKQSVEMKLNETLPELYDLRKKLDETKRMLDEENFRKANLEDQLRRLNDEHSFKMNVLEKQLEEVRSRREIEITEIDSKLIREYEDKLQKALHDLREVYDKQMDTNKEELSRIYDDRINELEAELNKERSRSSLSTNTLDETKSKIQALTSRISELESVNLGLQQKLSEYSQKLDDDRFTHRSQVGAKDREISKLLDELRRHQDQYQNLMDTKIILDMEIAVFRKLLESEEDRLGLDVDGGDGLVTRVTPPTPVPGQSQHKWVNGGHKSYTDI